MFTKGDNVIVKLGPFEWREGTIIGIEDEGFSIECQYIYDGCVNIDRFSIEDVMEECPPMEFKNEVMMKYVYDSNLLKDLEDLCRKYNKEIIEEFLDSDILEPIGLWFNTESIIIHYVMESGQHISTSITMKDFKDFIRKLGENIN